MSIPKEYQDKDVLRYVSLVGTGCRLILWYIGDVAGRPKLGYAFFPAKSRKPLFEGRDYSTGFSTSVDSDEALRGLMGFLTLRPGDTDAEYFDNYTPAQMAWAQANGEYMSEWGSDDPEAKRYCKFKNLA